MELVLVWGRESLLLLLLLLLRWPPRLTELTAVFRRVVRFYVRADCACLMVPLGNFLLHKERLVRLLGRPL